MLSDEIYKELAMSYYDLVDYLINKYGSAKYDYFYTSECSTKCKKVSRTSEGLICHHIREDVGVNLGESPLGKPFEWQKKENLVYCNHIEHLILHIKIAVLRQKTRLRQPYDVQDFFTSGGIFQITNTINDLFAFDGTKVKWSIRCYQEIKENYTDYIRILRAILEYIDSQYVGVRSKNRFLERGHTFFCGDSTYKIVDMTQRRNKLLLAGSDGTAWYDTLIFFRELSYADNMDYIARELCANFGNYLHDDIYDNMLDCPLEDVDSIVDKLSIDFRGFGFPQFTDIELDRAVFASINADEYISKALPSFSNPSLSLDGKVPHFWTGKIPSHLLRSNSRQNFIVRIESSFQIKDGELPFVRAGINISGYFSSDNNNYLTNRGDILESSGLFRIDGTVLQKCPITVSLEKHDFELFKQRYDIYSLKFLDGCYFK